VRRFVLALLTFLLLLGSVAHADPGGGPAFTDPDRKGAASGRISFTAEPGLEASARRLAPGAEAALARIEADLEGLPRVGRVEVRLVHHAESLDRVAPPGHGAPAWAVGVAWPDVGVVAVAAQQVDGTLVDLRSTLAHELAHMALERALGATRVPRWLHEGFAYQHSAEFEWGRAETLGGALFRGALLPIDALETSFPARHDAVALAYAESYDFVSYLAMRGRWPDTHDDGDRWPFRSFLQHVAHGESIDHAADAAFGRHLAELDAEWIETLRARYVWYPIAALGGFFWVLMAVLAMLGWHRRSRQMRARLAQMGAEEAAALAIARAEAEAAAAAASVQPPGDDAGVGGEVDGPVGGHVRVEERG
jgi:hypothetical protein